MSCVCHVPYVASRTVLSGGRSDACPVTGSLKCSSAHATSCSSLRTDCLIKALKTCVKAVDRTLAVPYARPLVQKTEEVIRGNPLLGLGGHDPSFEVKRRWDDDVVFKNQSRGEPKAQKRFINDTIRNDFHRKFLNRYVK